MPISLNRNKVRNELVKRIEEISAQDIFQCYQCGNCSSGCPVIDYMDISPNQVMRLAQLGEAEMILNSETIWICATCLQCSSRCPKGIDVAKVMEAVRSINLRNRDGIVKPDREDIEDIDELPPIALVSVFRKKTG
ncbi:MAG: 4Fe-4S dicluster domain-containing protein [Candidatus Cloacimonetes bacterium]|nr:4Fe-4S dicluster domain-containing protein [Candidatus Cloacimonadota bacterium]